LPLEKPKTHLLLSITKAKSEVEKGPNSTESMENKPAQIVLLWDIEQQLVDAWASLAYPTRPHPLSATIRQTK
jgi:hypothetical protein